MPQNDEILNESNSHRENYRFFYSYEYENAKEYAIENNYHMIWGSDNLGLNGDTYIVYDNADNLPQFLREYARGEEARGADLPYSYDEAKQLLYEKEMVEQTPTADRYTRISFITPNERVVSTSHPMSEADINKHFKEVFPTTQSVSDTHAMYQREKALYDVVQNRENVNNLVGLLESNASYEWSRVGSPWGYWSAHLVNPNQPQNYIDIGITGIERTNTALIEARLIENGNQLVQSFQTEISVNDVREMSDLDNGFTWQLDPSFRERVENMAGKISENYAVDLTYLSNEGEDKALSRHMEQLREAGHDIDNLDLSRYERVPNVSYFVAEAMEFHNLGAIYDNIASIEEAINVYENLPETRRNMGNGIGAIVDGDEISLYANGEVDTLEFYEDSIKTNDDILNAVKVLNERFSNARENEAVQENKSLHIPNMDLVANVQGIEFYSRQSNPTLIITYNENYHIEADEDVQRACERIFDNWYKDDLSEHLQKQKEEFERINTPIPNRYYEPQFDFDGTAEELYNQVRRGYIENVEDLNRIEEILRGENKNDMADMVSYYSAELNEDTTLYSFNRMKIDFADSRELHSNTGGGLDDVVISEDNNSRLSLTVMYEPYNDSVVVALSDNGEDYESHGQTVIPLDDFLNMSRADFDSNINELYYYGMERTEIEREERQLSRTIPIQEFADSDGHTYDGQSISLYRARQDGTINENGVYYATRTDVYNAVRDFELANNISNAVIDKNGNYEDKDILYSAYDEYVALSHIDELRDKYESIVKPYADMNAEYAVRMNAEQGYNMSTNPESYALCLYAQFYYAEKNGLNAEQIEVMAQYMANDDREYTSVRAEEMTQARQMLENGIDIDMVKNLATSERWTRDTIMDGFAYTKTPEQNLILASSKSAETAHGVTMLFIEANRDENQNLDPNRFNDKAEALVEVGEKFAERDKGKSWSDKFGEYGLEMLADFATARHNADGYELSADEIRYIGEKIIKDDKFYNPEEIKTIISEERNKKMAQQQESQKQSVSHGENNNGVGRDKNSSAIQDKKDRVNELRNMVRSGVEAVRNDESYKAWLRTRSHNFMNKYSFGNIIRVAFQNPNASTVMGYEQWKDYGRQVKAGAKGIDILVPMFYQEETSGNLCRDVMASLTSQLKTNDSAEYRLGDSGLHFIMNKGSNDIIARMPNGNEAIFKNRQELNTFIQRNIIGKLPRYYVPQKVFDVKGVSVPSFLTMKYGFSDSEVVKGKGVGVPISNNEGKVIAKAKWTKDPDAPKGYEWVDPKEIGKGTWELVSAPDGVTIETNPNRKSGKAEYLVINTEERKARFHDVLEMAVIAKDPAVMNTLFDSIKQLSEEKGVPVKVVSKDSSEWTTSKEANGYFHRTEGMEKAIYPKGYIVIPTELLNSDPAHACKTLVHEMAHADLHGEIEKLEQEMGGKVTRAMKETQAESVAFMVCENFGIDSSDYSFKYLATWASDAELKDFEKSLNVIDREARQLVDEISAKLERNGLSRDLKELPKEALSAESIRSTVEIYAKRIHENSALLTSLNDEVAVLAEQSKDNIDKTDIIMRQKDNIEKRQNEIETQINLVEKLEVSTDRKTQDDIISQLDSSFKRDANLSMAYQDLSESLKTIAIRNKEGLREQFMQNGQATLTKMSKDFPQLDNLLKKQKQYIAKSPFIRTYLSPLLNTNPQLFVNEVVKRANDAMKIASKDGMFVEVVSCKSHTEPPILNGGELAHPKVADKIVSEAEKQIRSLKENSDFFPSAEMKLAIFSVTEKDNISCYITAPIRVGDMTQDGLSDYLHKACAEKKELIASFDKAVKERGAKEKMIDFENSHGENSEQGHNNVERVTMEQAEAEIGARRELNNQQCSQEQQTEKTKNTHDRGKE